MTLGCGDTAVRLAHAFALVAMPLLGSPPPARAVTPLRDPACATMPPRDPNRVVSPPPCSSPRPCPHPRPSPCYCLPPRPCPRCRSPCSSATPMLAPTPDVPPPFFLATHVLPPCPRLQCCHLAHSCGAAALAPLPCGWGCEGMSTAEGMNKVGAGTSGGARRQRKTSSRQQGWRQRLRGWQWEGRRKVFFYFKKTGLGR